MSLAVVASAAPDVLKSDFGMSQPPALGRLHLDNSIVLSQNSSLGGRIGLHAAAAGGETLLKVYAGCGLTKLPASSALPPAILRQNDERFFLTDEAQAEHLAAMLDPSR